MRVFPAAALGRQTRAAAPSSHPLRRRQGRQPATRARPRARSEDSDGAALVQYL